LNGKLGQANNPEWKTVAFDQDDKTRSAQRLHRLPLGPKAARQVEPGDKEARGGERSSSSIHLRGEHPTKSLGGLPLLRRHRTTSTSPPTRPRTTSGAPGAGARIKLARTAKSAWLVATVFDLMVANYGVTAASAGAPAPSYDEDVPYTPAWQEKITGVRAKVITVARQFADNADKTQGKSMIIIGAAMNHWYHMDMNYRGVINMLMMCGCIGQSGGGWAHYVGQEKLRPQTGWQPLAFALDWYRPPRHMNSTSFFYAHTDQWRYEKLGVDEILSPLADRKTGTGSLIDYNVRAERMGWLPSAPRSSRPTRCRSPGARPPARTPRTMWCRQLKDGRCR
jgi:nitrate reductase / nitrite oxidoreductase, alpha subunit